MKIIACDSERKICFGYYENSRSLSYKVAQVFLYGVISVLILGGCASTKTVNPNLNIEPYKTTKQPYTLAIDGRKLLDTKTTANPGAVELTVHYGDALLESIRHQIQNSYRDVYVIRSEQDIKQYDYVAFISNSITSSCGGVSCDLNSKTSLILNDSQGTVLTSSTIDDNFAWVEPGGAVACGIITGMTLFITAPVFVPIGLDIECEELKNQISASNDRISQRIAETIVNKSRVSLDDSQAKNQISTRLEKLNELFIKGLIPKETYENKQKEILEGL